MQAKNVYSWTWIQVIPYSISHNQTHTNSHRNTHIFEYKQTQTLTKKHKNKFIQNNIWKQLYRESKINKNPNTKIYKE